LLVGRDFRTRPVNAKRFTHEKRHERMVPYIIRRLLWMVPTLLAMALITFTIMHLTPGSPLDPVADNANPLSPEAQRNMAKQYGLDKPVWQQFVIFLAKAVRGDFGSSYVYKNRAVHEIIRQAFPVSLHLGGMALAVALVWGLTLGISAAMYRIPGRLPVLPTAMLAVASPNFVVAVFLFLLSLVLQLVPTGGWDAPSHWLLPTLTLALGPMAMIARFTRSTMIDVIRADFVRTARAKGLHERRVILVHVVKNAMIPVLTIVGPLFAGIGTGSFFVETIFRVPGLGRFFVESMTGRDYPMIMAVVLLYGVFLALMNLLVDLLYGVLDPRIRYA
jgi:ABC-type dipeptide/oligopeptide/nickel transport system permease component